MPRSQPHIQLRWNHHNSYKNRGKWKGDCKVSCAAPRWSGFLNPCFVPDSASRPTSLEQNGHHMLMNRFGFFLCNYSGANSTFLSCQNNDFEPAEFGMWMSTNLSDREKEKCHPKALRFFRIILQLTCLMDPIEKIMTYFKHETWPFFWIWAI